MANQEKESNAIQELENASGAVSSTNYDAEKLSATAYVAQNESSYHKSKEERRLVMKMDFLILPLAALLYLAAYLVCMRSVNYARGRPYAC